MRASYRCAVVGLLIAAAGSALAQSSESVACPGGGGGGGSQNDRAGNRVFTFNPPYIGVKGLTGAPFSGQQSSVQSRTPANSTLPMQIPATTAPMMYRDGQGRTRFDARTGPQNANGATQILGLPEILDSVAGYRYILDDYHKVAYRTKPCMWPVGSGYSPENPLAPAAVARGITRTTEDLGTQTMSGVTVTGTRYTTTFPTGTYQGNDHPVINVEEDWRSAEFGINFLTKNVYPDRETTQTMTNFTAGEPNPALFQVPDGYEIVDESSRFTITIPQTAPQDLPGAPGQVAAARPSLAQSEAVAACPAMMREGGSVGQTGSVFQYRGPSSMPAEMTGAPYSGQMTFQTVRTLAGNTTHLIQNAAAQPMKHRDSAGRMRSDSTMTAQPLAGHSMPQISSLAEIDDPVAGYIYILDDFHKIAYRIVPCSRPAPPRAIAARYVRSPITQPGSRGADGTDLGTQTMSGVAVTGWRVTTMVGQGSDQSAARVEEAWYSAEFGLNFLTKTTTPESETTQTMTNFTAGEPDPSIFRIPAGYQIVDENAAFTVMIPYQGQ